MEPEALWRARGERRRWKPRLHNRKQGIAPRFRWDMWHFRLINNLGSFHWEPFLTYLSMEWRRSLLHTCAALLSPPPLSGPAGLHTSVAPQPHRRGGGRMVLLDVTDGSMATEAHPLHLRWLTKVPSNHTWGGLEDTIISIASCDAFVILIRLVLLAPDMVTYPNFSSVPLNSHWGSASMEQKPFWIVEKGVSHHVPFLLISVTECSASVRSSPPGSTHCWFWYTVGIKIPSSLT